MVKKRKVIVKAKGSKKAKAPKAAKRKVTRQTALPGMGQVRNAKLDKLCENIGEARERKNEAIADEEGDSQAALRVMQDSKVDHYTHAGVELIRRHGADKLSIKLLKDKSAEGALSPDADAGIDAGEDAPANVEHETQREPEFV